MLAMTLLQSFGGWLAVQAMRRPYLMRTGLTIARNTGPIVKAGSNVILTRADDVLEVLERHQDFHTEAHMGPKMLWGSFVLGQDDSPGYRHERQTLVDALKLSQVKIMATVKSQCADLLQDRNGELDLARDFVSRVALRIEQQVFGVRMDDAKTRTGLFRSETGELAVEFWLRTLGSVIAQGAPAPLPMQARGERCARELRQLAQQALEEQRRMPPADDPDSLLGYLVKHLPEPDAQERCLAGLMVVNYGIIVRALCLSIDRLLDVDGAMERLNTLATTNDREGLAEMWREALRFNPPIPFVVRHAARDLVIAAGTERATRVAAGDEIALPLWAAMMDPATMPEPGKFALDRPADVYHHFGAGIHRCLGRFIAEPELTELYLELFSRVRVSRIPGPRGKVIFDDLGPAVRHLRVEVKPL